MLLLLNYTNETMKKTSCSNNKCNKNKNDNNNELHLAYSISVAYSFGIQ